MSQAERIAENEAFCRDLNESRHDWLRSGLQVAGFSMRVLADRLRRPHTTVQPGMGGGPVASGALRGRAWAHSQ